LEGGGLLPVTTAWRILMMQTEKASRYTGSCECYWTSSRR